MQVAGGDDLLPHLQNAALGLCGDEAVSSAVQTIENGTGIAADATDCGADRVEAGDHLFDRLKARMPEDVRHAERRESFALDPDSLGSRPGPRRCGLAPEPQTAAEGTRCIRVNADERRFWPAKISTWR
jgi:hypothetical protein